MVILQIRKKIIRFVQETLIVWATGHVAIMRIVEIILYVSNLQVVEMVTGAVTNL